VLKRGAFFSRWQVQQKESCKKSPKDTARERGISTTNLTSCKISTEKQNLYDKEEGRKKAQLRNLLPETLRMLGGPTLLRKEGDPQQTNQLSTSYTPKLGLKAQRMTGGQAAHLITLRCSVVAAAAAGRKTTLM
jgi:hypothetical protein